MSPLVAHQVAEMRANFQGKVIVVEDYGHSATVLVVPQDWLLRQFRKVDGVTVGAEPVDEDDDWARVTEPVLVTIDPLRTKGPKAS